jgi:hypothetical protein
VPALEEGSEDLPEASVSADQPSAPQGTPEPSLLQLTDRLGHAVHSATNAGRIPVALASELRACRDALDEGHRSGETPPDNSQGRDDALKDALASLQRIAGAR